MDKILAAVRNGYRLVAVDGKFVLARRAPLVCAPQRHTPDECLFFDEVKQLVHMGLLVEDGFGSLRAGPILI